MCPSRRRSCANYAAQGLALLVLGMAAWAPDTQAQRVAGDVQARLASPTSSVQRVAQPAQRGGAPSIRLIESTPRGAVYEVRASWNGRLADLVRRHAANPEALMLAAVQGYATLSETITLPSLVSPVVEVISADYDEVSLPSVSSLERSPEELREAQGYFDIPAAEVVALGMERREPTGALSARLFQIDRERGVVRRYRRMLISVRYGSGSYLRGAGFQNPHLGVSRSALADGTWYKIPITREGMYRIDRAYLQSLGVNVNGLNPASLQVFGNGGASVPAVNMDDRHPDLVENAVLVTGSGDGSFDEGDALFFYAEAPNGWTWIPDSDPDDGEDDSHWAHYINYFSVTNYVFLRVDGANGARVGGTGFPAWPDAVRQTQFAGRMFVEEDFTNLFRNGGGSGLEWMGAETSVGRSTITLLDTIPPGLVGGTVTYRIRAAARANPAVTLSFTSGGQELGSVRPGSIVFGSATSPLGKTAETTMEQTVSGGGAVRLNMTMQGTQNNPIAWIDWAEAVYPRVLNAHEGVLRFHTPGGETGRFEFALGGFSGQPRVWDITNPADIKPVGVRAEGGQYLAQVDVAVGDAPYELVAFVTASSRMATPAAGQAVGAQNLHAIAGYPDYVIVTHSDFRTAAEDLAAHRRTNDGLATVVVDIDEIYNEFSGGKVDMRAMRDYLKFLYDRAPTANELPRYVLLFGDGHYDYRGRTEVGNFNNFIPTYETFESLVLLESYTSDEYHGFLDDEEGAWAWPGQLGTGTYTDPDCMVEGCPSISERVDVGIGRIPSRTAEEAAAVVAKIIHYDDPSTFGAWRTRYTVVADDEFPGSGDVDLHLQNADVVADRVDTSAVDLNIQKIYSTSYPHVVTAVGRRIPEARAEIRRVLEEGTLVWNYSGHGGHTGLADEKLLTLEDIETFDNFDNLPIFVTATCSFGRFDMVDRQSGAELLLLTPDGGAIAIFTTVRIVFASSGLGTYNLGLNLQLVDELLPRDDDGRPRRLGDVIRLTKGSDVGAQGNNHKFSMLGDPAMRVGLPRRAVAITSVNGQPLPGSATAGMPTASSIRIAGMPELRANELAEITGQVLGFDGLPDLAFEGEVDLEVFDALRSIPIDPSIAVYTDGDYDVRTDRIYRGRAQVRNGAFTVQFIVPRDVSYTGETGRISAFVRSATGIDGMGSTEEFRISETAGPPLNDHDGPEMSLFINDSTFVDGGLIGDDATLVVRLFDENGINTVGTGVGHELLLMLDNDPTPAIEIGRFYVGDLDSYQRGVIRFPLPEQAAGAHTLSVTVWDVANNSSTGQLTYVREGSEKLALRHVYNYPNPTTGATRFVFEHNQAPGTLARIQLRIFSLSGRPVRTIEFEESLTGGLVQIPFDGLDEDLDALGSGIYLYRLRVAVDRLDGETDVAEHIERLAVIR